VNHDPLDRLDSHWEERDDEQKESVSGLVLMRMLLLVEHVLLRLVSCEPTPPRETTLRLVIIVVGLVLIVIAMVLGGAASEVDEVIKHLPFPPCGFW
jgi:hypothetical protein